MMTHNALLRLCRARDLLCDPAGFELPINAVAKAAALSEFHFTRQFAALFGETPHQYRTRARLQHAKRLLLAERGSVTDVCCQVGFSSLGSFSALFARRFGEPPSSYRRRLLPSSHVESPMIAPACVLLLQGAWLTPQFWRSLPGGPVGSYTHQV
jgi:AraC-like DNA-binding protein